MLLTVLLPFKTSAMVGSICSLEQAFCRGEASSRHIIVRQIPALRMGILCQIHTWDAWPVLSPSQTSGAQGTDTPRTWGNSCLQIAPAVISVRARHRPRCL